MGHREPGAARASALRDPLAKLHVPLLGYPQHRRAFPRADKRGPVGSFPTRDGTPLSVHADPQHPVISPHNPGLWASPLPWSTPYPPFTRCRPDRVKPREVIELDLRVVRAGPVHRAVIPAEGAAKHHVLLNEAGHSFGAPRDRSEHFILHEQLTPSSSAREKPFQGKHRDLDPKPGTLPLGPRSKALDVLRMRAYAYA